MERLTGAGLQHFGYPPATAAGENPAQAREWANRKLYRWRFSSRLWFRMPRPLGEWFSDTSLWQVRLPPDEADETRRHGQRLESIRPSVDEGN